MLREIYTDQAINLNWIFFHYPFFYRTAYRNIFSLPYCITIRNPFLEGISLLEPLGPDITWVHIHTVEYSIMNQEINDALYFDYYP